MSFVHSVVTGATGQVGLELCRGLRAAGKSVRAVVLPGDPALARLRELGVEPFEADVRDAPALRRALQGATHLYHLAAIVSTTARHDLRMWQVNVEGARNAARAARELGIGRMVYFSSIVVFDPEPLHEPLHEGRPRMAVAAGSPYVRSKIAGEEVVREQVEQGLDAVVVHPTVVIGPNETHHVGVVQTLLFNYFAGRLPAVFAGGFDAVAAGDVVDGAMAAAERGRPGESYILGGEQHTILGLLRRAQALCGARVPRVAIPLPLARAGLPLVDAVARITRMRPAFTPEDLRQLDGNPHIDTSKARRELGYRPDGLDRALAMVHEEWLRRARCG
ncbi:NAD-dependent epimerase/dehydratase family protein [Paraliomyxa miuraensis]|uniref:NAD-dependent epimerase/dehydratase family protein n=1 Tax=Paraliomyxa miuraensis TaxID=376150 RepID=UPI002259C43A|nr:NAD-dependent epimerase/dehydratase family protein [Paraliomyxa miuraensis]MCX4242049.1 NAD-dependent epimerase/dehydratase family protein [Paraliomyxa miuraensis]